MKGSQLFLSGFLVMLCFFMGCNAEAGDSRNQEITSQKSISKEKHDNQSKAIKANRKKTVSNTKSVTSRSKADTAEQNELQKPLDLSVPYRDMEKTDPLANQEPVKEKSSIFSNLNEKKSRPIQLDGKLLMSQEPEAEKRKSADGAAIIINVKP